MRSVFRLRRLWCLLSIPLAFLLLYLAGANQSFAETYAVRVYPVLARFGNGISSAVPFSVGEGFVCAVILLFAAALVRLIIRLIRGKGKRGAAAAKFCVNLLCAAGILFLLFTLNCGINYRRSTFAETCGLTVQDSPKEELESLCRSLAEKANELRPACETDDSSVMALRSRVFAQNAEKARAAFDGLSADYPLLTSGYGAPKPVLASKLMSQCNITGIFFPFTLEANVNTDVPEYTLPFTMCHELSHLRGYMREDEANFIAYLACEKSSDPDFQYSGAAMAFTYANNALYSSDGQAAGKIYSALSEGVRRDLAFNNAYWDQFKGPAAEVSEQANNNYLKANAQPDGVQSYGRMVDLLLALQRSAKD